MTNTHVVFKIIDIFLNDYNCFSFNNSVKYTHWYCLVDTSMLQPAQPKQILRKLFTRSVPEKMPTPPNQFLPLRNITFSHIVKFNMALSDTGPETICSLPIRLKDVLNLIHHDDCPIIPSCGTRAAVALVIRVRPNYIHQAVYDSGSCSSSDLPFQICLDNFFSQSWVNQGDPEVLFIKRAARRGDRWTSHIALPGGKREPADPHDRATSSRETREETGLEVDTGHCLFIGNLPERVIKTACGKVP